MAADGVRSPAMAWSGQHAAGSRGGARGLLAALLTAHRANHLPSEQRKGVQRVNRGEGQQPALQTGAPEP